MDLKYPDVVFSSCRINFNFMVILSLIYPLDCAYLLFGLSIMDNIFYA